MTLFQIVFLAIIQGLTEFLPISSSAHLILPAQLLGWISQGLEYDVAVHVGSLLAVVIYFRRDIFKLTHDWFQYGLTRHQTASSRLAWQVIIATIPAIIAGLLLKEWVSTYGRSLEVIAATTIVFGLLLWLADIKAKQHKSTIHLTMRDTIIIGIAQALAVIPGTSRSGVTMTAGLLLGLDRQSAARFSFLLSIPVIFGAGTLETWDLVNSKAPVDWATLALGAFFSFLFAYACIALFLKWISKIGMLPFVIYRLVLGAILLVFIFY